MIALASGSEAAPARDKSLRGEQAETKPTPTLADGNRLLTWNGDPSETVCTSRAKLKENDLDKE